MKICTNLSSAKMRGEAKKKFLTRVAMFLAVDALVLFSVPWGVWYAVWAPILAYANVRYLARLVFFGYFICERDRRLKYGGHLHPEKVGDMVVCDRCVEEVGKVLKILENTKKAADELVVAISQDPRLNGRSGQHLPSPSRKIFRPSTPLEPEIPTVDLGQALR